MIQLFITAELMHNTEDSSNYTPMPSNSAVNSTGDCLIREYLAHSYVFIINFAEL